jgi:hypothetical protein
MRLLLIALLLGAAQAAAAPRQIDEFRWDRVDRVVAIGDLHGDFDAYLAVLKAAGVVDARGRWSAGETHLVQTGDIPDRGPDTRRIIEHLQKLSKQAERRGGRVHALIGNHEAMNVYGDLRYVTAGEYAAFADRRSEALRERYFKLMMRQMQEQQPERFESLPEDFATQWMQQHPPGWLEHRMAWDPRWQGDAELFDWVRRNKVAVQINELLFVHGGISHAYCGNSLESLTSMARAALPAAAGHAHTTDAADAADAADDPEPDILQDALGPLWYRGLAGIEPAASLHIVGQILQRHGVRHIVIGHSPTGGVIWPRLDGRVILIDTGMSSAYGGHVGWLESGQDGLIAGYPQARLRLPVQDAQRLDYLQQVVELQPDNRVLSQRLAEFRAGLREHLLVAPLQATEQPAEAEPNASNAAAGTAAQAGSDPEPEKQAQDAPQVSPLQPVLTCDTAR